MKVLSGLNLKEVAIFRALQLGDLVCSIPAIRAFKTAYPLAQLTLIGLPWAESFASRFSHYFSDFIHFPGHPGLPEQPFEAKNYISFLQESNQKQFDLLLQMHGNGTITNPVVSILSVEKSGGYFKKGQYKPDEALFMPYPEDCPEVERHLRLMQFLGLPLQGNHLEFPITEKELKACGELCSSYGLEAKQYVCIHAGARDVSRRWPAHKFSVVADAIAAKGYRIVLTGTEAERELTNRVAKEMQYPAINCAGQTDLGTLAALIKNAKMLFSNDTGVSHIAAAVETPSVVIYLTSDPDRWAPLNRNLHKVVLPGQADNTGYVTSVVAQALQEKVMEGFFILSRIGLVTDFYIVNTKTKA